MKNNYCIILLLLVLSFNTLWAQKHPLSPVKVLFVGYDPAKPMPEIKRMAPAMMTEKDFKEEYPVRMPSFKALLSTYFKEVATIDCRDWKPEDSEPYDVTIFDFATRKLEPEKMEAGNNYTAARYLPDNFSKPVIFIASTADEMGRRIGLKLDWLCLCLDADAHHLNKDHAIFKGPLEKVVPTMVSKKTPEGIYHYSTGAYVPKELPMWRVQKTGYLEGKGGRIGLVSRGGRFSESPDTETISSGVCAKDVGAVALGRHGNFFLWGFSASPAGMTEEGKKVFVNAVAYMSKFDGKMPMARKYNDRMATTDDIREIIASAKPDRYPKYVKSIEEFNEANARQFKLLTEKKAAGKTLTKEEEESMNYIGRPQAVMSEAAFIKQTMGQYADRFGTDLAAFQKFMSDNFAYMYCDPTKFFNYSVDEDVQKIGISNHDPKLLKKCVEMLKSGNQPELALRVLKRYTAQNFETVADWSKWYDANHKNLFFTETDGYRFMINTYKS